MKAFIRNIRIAPKKMNLIAVMVRGKSVEEALAILKFTPKKAAPILYKAIQSAAANAEKNDLQKKENLIIESLYVGKEPTLKRFNPVSRGRAHPIKKRGCQVSVYLASKDAVKPMKEVKKVPGKVAEKAEAPAEEVKVKKVTKSKKAPANS
ncbi:MAG: 50S ribosomal protein L22 [Patescibacteria group bacterium]|mgnify:CR=1 FL=1